MARKPATTTEPTEKPDEAPAPAIRKMPVRLEPCELEEPYDGFTFTANRNYTIKELEEMSSGYYYRMLPVLKALVTEWDFADRDGKPLAFGNDAWGSLGVDLIVAMSRAVMGLTSVPNR